MLRSHSETASNIAAALGMKTTSVLARFTENSEVDPKSGDKRRERSPTDATPSLLDAAR
jgi:hypothetical protein